MASTLGPIDASPHDWSPACASICDVDPDFGEDVFAVARQFQTRSNGAKRAHLNEAVGEGDAEPPGKVIVAGTRFTESSNCGALRECDEGCGPSDKCERFHRLGHVN